MCSTSYHQFHPHTENEGILWSTLIQIRPGAKPLPTSILTFCQLGPKQHFQLNFIWTSKLFVKENVFEIVVCKVVAILLKPQHINVSVILKFHGAYSSLFGSPDSKVHGANMGPIWGRQAPGGPHVGPMNFAIWEAFSLLLPRTLFPCSLKISESWRNHTLLIITLRLRLHGSHFLIQNFQSYFSWMKIILFWLKFL